MLYHDHNHQQSKTQQTTTTTKKNELKKIPWNKIKFEMYLEALINELCVARNRHITWVLKEKWGKREKEHS